MALPVRRAARRDAGPSDKPRNTAGGPSRLIEGRHPLSTGVVAGCFRCQHRGATRSYPADKLSAVKWVPIIETWYKVEKAPMKQSQNRHSALLGPVFALVLTVAAGFAADAPPTAALAGENSAFIAGVEDLPLMPGLAEVSGAGIVFDKPSGRIVEAYAEGPVSRADVAWFYADVAWFYLETLPHLGWQAKAESIFAREGERLQLIYLGSDGDLVVRFVLQPE